MERRGSEEVRSSEPKSKPLGMYVTSAEKKILLTIGKLMQEKEANRNGKTIAREAGYSRPYTSEILSGLREKNLIETVNLGAQKIHSLTLQGKTAIFRLSAGSCAEQTSQYDSTLRKWKIRTRGHDFRFKAEVLSGPSFPDRWMPSYRMDGLIGNVCYEYEVTCMFFLAEKTKKRYVVLRVPSFFSEKFETTIFEAREYAKRTLDQLTQDHGYTFSDLVYTFSHIAVSEDPVTYFAEENIGFVESEDKRLKLDSSKGYDEFEAVTKLGPEDMELIFNELFAPVYRREFSVIDMVKRVRLAQQQIRTDQLIFSENQTLFSENEKLLGENLKTHVAIVSSLDRAANQLEKALEILTDRLLKLEQREEEERKEREKSFLQKIRETGQKLLEDFS